MGLLPGHSNLVFIVLPFRFPQVAVLFPSPDRSANFADCQYTCSVFCNLQFRRLR